MLIGRTLGVYFSARFLRAIFTVFATVFALVYTLDFVELMRRAGDTQGATAGLMAELALLRAPLVVEQVLPFAILFGSITAFLTLSRKLELVVARASGVSVWGLLQPGILLVLALGVGSVMLYNPLSTHLKQRANTLEAKAFTKPGAVGVVKDLWIRQNSTDGQAILRAEGASLTDQTVLSQVTVFTFETNGGFRERIEARQARLETGYWELADARVMSVAEEPQTYTTYLLATTLDPAQVRQSFTQADAVSFWDLDRVITGIERSGLDATRYRLQRDTLLARPLLFVAMVLIAACVSLRFFRMGGVAAIVLGGIVAGFTLYVGTELMGLLGSSGLINTALAAWSIPALGSLLGIVVLLYQEDG